MSWLSAFLTRKEASRCVPLALILCAGSILAGCAAPQNENGPATPLSLSPDAAGDTAPSGPAERYPSLKDAKWDTFSRSSIWMAEPAAGVLAPITSPEALKAVALNGLNPALMMGDPETALKVVTNDLLRGAAPEEELTGGFYNRLAWVVLFHESHPVVEGDDASVTSAECILLVTVDAATAEVLTIDQSCGGPADIGYSPRTPAP